LLLLESCHLFIHSTSLSPSLSVSVCRPAMFELHFTWDWLSVALLISAAIDLYLGGSLCLNGPSLLSSVYSDNDVLYLLKSRIYERDLGHEIWVLMLVRCSFCLVSALFLPYQYKIFCAIICVVCYMYYLLLLLVITPPLEKKDERPFWKGSGSKQQFVVMNAVSVVMYMVGIYRYFEA